MSMLSLSHHVRLGIAAGENRWLVQHDAFTQPARRRPFGIRIAGVCRHHGPYATEGYDEQKAMMS